MGGILRIALLIMAAGVLAGTMLNAAVAPVAPELTIPEPGKAAGETVPAGPSVTGCVVAGTLQCSEYGSRFRDTLMLVLVDEGGRFISSISDTNGSFALPVPCGGGFELRVEFADRGLSVGRIELPESPEGSVYTLEIRHSGSYLELVRDVRNGMDEDDITYRLVKPGD